MVFQQEDLGLLLLVIYMVKMENDVVTPLKPKFYRMIYLTMIYLTNVRNIPKKAYRLPPKHLADQVLDMKLSCVNGIYKTMVYRKTTKVPIRCL